jgi:hypothetical protein
MSDDTFWTVYENALLRFGRARQTTVDLRNPVTAHLRAELSALGLNAQFAVITAHNPGGRTLSAIRNRWRNARLRVALAACRARVVPASGESRDGSHREQGFAAAMDRSDAVRLAQRFGQLAIYWFDGEHFWLDGVLAARPPERLPASSRS